MNEFPLNIIKELIALPHETEWVEFKLNHAVPEDIGEYISALANAAALHGKNSGYIVWGVEDETHQVVGTTFRPRTAKVGNQELESWLALQLSPRIDFTIYECGFRDLPVVLFEIPRATHQPVLFRGVDYIRIGSYKKKLKEFPEKERQLWSIFEKVPFESLTAMENTTADEVLRLLDYPAYFDLTDQPLPENKAGILRKLESERFIVPKTGGKYDISNLGAILFAKKLSNFDRLSRKAIRVVIYKGKSRIETIREHTGARGYASGYEGAVSYINDQLPQSEVVGMALRREERMCPEIAIRELVANAIIHQDFFLTGTGPMVEIFEGRIEITNPGIPLIDTLRFIDEPPQSRNEALASFMRRINICEERGSGIDKVITAVEFAQLPAPEFLVTTNHTKAVLFARRDLADMDKNDRIRACYQHSVLKYLSDDFMTNASLRERLLISKKNYPMASRIIADTMDAALIHRHDPSSMSRKHAKYVPFWA